jgi:hypothetical protein
MSLAVQVEEKYIAPKLDVMLHVGIASLNCWKYTWHYSHRHSVRFLLCKDKNSEKNSRHTFFSLFFFLKWCLKSWPLCIKMMHTTFFIKIIHQNDVRGTYLPNHSKSKSTYIGGHVGTMCPDLTPTHIT